MTFRGDLNKKVRTALHIGFKTGVFLLLNTLIAYLFEKIKYTYRKTPFLVPDVFLSKNSMVIPGTKYI